MTVYLKFPDEATFAASMPDGWERRGETAHPLTVGGRYDDDGKQLEAPTVIPGYHVNALGEMPEAWRDYIVTPRSPLAVFGGGNA